jgi:hypothetical protein
MGKINWGTTAEVLGGIGTKVAQKLGENKAKKQATSYNSSGSAVDSSLSSSSGDAGSYKRGGVVKKTGLARVHKGERVLTKKQRRKYDSGKKR